MSPRNTCERRVGRLVEVRIDAGYRNVHDVNEIVGEFLHYTSQVPEAVRLVVVTDWRKCRVMGEDAAIQLAGGMRISNPRIERSGVLLPETSPVAMLQFVRMLREGNNAARRGFSEPSAMITWLAEVLTPEELTRLRAFLA
jgi:hypothetical protein